MGVGGTLNEIASYDDAGNAERSIDAIANGSLNLHAEVGAVEILRCQKIAQSPSIGWRAESHRAILHRQCARDGWRTALPWCDKRNGNLRWSECGFKKSLRRNLQVVTRGQTHGDRIAGIESDQSSRQHSNRGDA